MTSSYVFFRNKVCFSLGIYPCCISIYRVNTVPSSFPVLYFYFENKILKNHTQSQSTLLAVESQLCAKEVWKMREIIASAIVNRSAISRVVK